MSISELFIPQKSYTDLHVHSVITPDVKASRYYSTTIPRTIIVTNFPLSPIDVINGTLGFSTNNATIDSIFPDQPSLDAFIGSRLLGFITFTTHVSIIPGKTLRINFLSGISTYDGQNFFTITAPSITEGTSRTLVFFKELVNWVVYY